MARNWKIKKYNHTISELKDKKNIIIQCGSRDIDKVCALFFFSKIDFLIVLISLSKSKNILQIIRKTFDTKKMARNWKIKKNNHTISESWHRQGAVSLLRDKIFFQKMDFYPPPPPPPLWCKRCEIHFISDPPPPPPINFFLIKDFLSKKIFRRAWMGGDTTWCKIQFLKTPPPPNFRKTFYHVTKKRHPRYVHFFLFWIDFYYSLKYFCHKCRTKTKFFLKIPDFGRKYTDPTGPAHIYMWGAATALEIIIVLRQPPFFYFHFWILSFSDFNQVP